ncbi:hypothetical protein ACFL35_20090 [Candidatus Riflebacteria bacterium]
MFTEDDKKLILRLLSSLFIGIAFSFAFNGLDEFRIYWIAGHVFGLGVVLVLCYKIESIENNYKNFAVKNGFKLLIPGQYEEKVEKKFCWLKDFSYMMQEETSIDGFMWKKEDGIDCVFSIIYGEGFYTYYCCMLIGESLKLPDFFICPETLYKKIQIIFGAEDIAFADDKEFDAAFQVKGKDSEKIRNFFSPRIKKWFREHSYNCEGSKHGFMLVMPVDIRRTEYRLDKELFDKSQNLIKHAYELKNLFCDSKKEKLEKKILF